MLVFALIVAPDDALGQRKFDWLRANAADLLPFKPSGTVTWQAPRSPVSIRAVAWLNDPFHPTSRYIATSPESLRIRQGWQAEGSGGRLGEYLYVDIDAEGNGGLRRNLSPIYALYAGSRDGVTIIANRKLVAAAALAEATELAFNDDFVACTIGCGWPLGTHTLFRGIEALRSGAEPRFSAGRIDWRKPPDDPWHSPELKGAHAADPHGFWRDRIDELDRVADRFFAPDGKPLLNTFSLSSGKDSRLLFAVLNRRPRFREVPVLTHGSPYQHDVVVAGAIARHFGMEHRVSDSVFQTIELERMLPEHLFLTEGRSSPSDLMAWRAQRQEGIHAIGHELGLRDVIDRPPAKYNVNSTFVQMKKFFTGFDRLGILQPDAHEKLTRMFWDQIERLYATSRSPENVAWRLYMENRVLHYLSLVKMKDESQRESPYALMTDPLVQAAYTLGLRARLEERVHYELLRRLDPWLTYDCPFGGQRWPMALRVAEGGPERFAPTIPPYASKKAPPKGTYAAFDANRAAFRDFVMDTVGRLDHVVDRARVEQALARPSWTPHEMGAMWYLVQYCGGWGADWRLLSPLNRDRRPASFPKVRYASGSDKARDKPGEEAAVNAIYRDVVPGAVYAVARDEQIRELLREADDLWARDRRASAFQLYAAAATLGDPHALFVLGRCYLNGDVVKPDAAQAVSLLTLAKDRGVAAAAGLLGACYAEGNAVQKNKARAIQLFEEAAALGDFWALERAANLKDQAGEPSTDEWRRLEQALIEFTRTRAHGHANYLLGLIYLEGRVGKPDPNRAAMFFKVARDLGSKPALERLNHILAA